MADAFVKENVFFRHFSGSWIWFSLCLVMMSKDLVKALPKVADFQSIL